MSHLTTYFLDSTGGRNPHDYVGWIVESINGIDPVKYIQDYADRFVSISKSPDTRFNLALASVQYVEGEWRPFDGYLYRTSNLMAVISSGGKRPSSADSDLKQAGANEAIGSVRYALLDPSTGRRETVTANWAGDFEGFRDGLASREAYYGKCAGRKAVVPPAPGASRSGDGDGVYGSSGSHSDSGVENSLDSEEVDLADFANADLTTIEKLFNNRLYRCRLGTAATPTNANVPKMFANGNNEIISSELYNVMAAPQVDWNYLRDKISQTHGDLITPTHPSSVQPQDLPAAARSKGENLTVGIPAPQRPTKKKDEREPIVSDRNGAFYKLDNATGVWVLSTFIPSAQTPRGVADWLGSMVRGLDALEDVGVRKLLIHVSGNGGGFHIPLSFDMRYTPLLETLIASAPPISPLSVTGVGILPANATAPTTPVTPDDPPAAVAYARNVSDVFPTDPDQQRVLTRGGRSSVYSVRFNQVALCNEFVNEFASMMRGRLGGSKGRRAGTSARRDAAPGKDGGDGEGGDSAKAGDGHGDVDGTTAGDISEDKDAPGHIASPKLDQYHRRLWDPRDIVVVSDGFCGSACGHLVRMLRDGHGVRSIVYGGGLASARAATGGAFTPSSFEGANVVMFNDLLSVYRRSQRTATRTGDPASNHRRDASPSPPPQELFPFPLRARGQVALWEAYSDSGSGGTRAPMEWVVHPADAGVGAAATAAAPGSGGAAATAGLGVADPEGVVRVWKRATAMLDAWRPAGGGAAAAAPSSGK
ncbi:hypothetical protein DFJ73DRAFT_893274 [Zopfochytrium polystomum]|nr:hypothetical protein DFJ73DRAFT_893274 [Zopfochytrium polystomum]